MDCNLSFLNLSKLNPVDAPYYLIDLYRNVNLQEISNSKVKQNKTFSSKIKAEIFVIAV